ERRPFARGLFFVVVQSRFTQATADHGHGSVRVAAARRDRDLVNWPELQDALLALSACQHTFQRDLHARRLSAWHRGSGPRGGGRRHRQTSPEPGGGGTDRRAREEAREETGCEEESLHRETGCEARRGKAGGGPCRGACGIHAAAFGRIALAECADSA